MVPLLSYLREVGSPPAAGAVDDTAGCSARAVPVWMVQERGLAATTVLRYENTARRFLQSRPSRRWSLRAGGV